MVELGELLPHRMDLEAGGGFDPKLLPAHGGVYAIADGDGRPILMAACEGLRRVVAARLSGPGEGPSKRANLAEVARRVYWTATFGAFETSLRYHAIARQLYPRDYRERLGFGPAWFIRGDAREPIPRITVVKEYGDDGAAYVGPFATRGDAVDTVGVLEDAFDLCRKYDILRQAPRGQACEYLEMGKCPAPCDGRWPMEAYRASIGAAMAFAAGSRAGRIGELDAMMRAAATQLQFERAAAIRQTMERARSHFAREAARLAGRLEDFRWLIVQRGGPRSRSEKKMLIKPFFASWRAVIEGAATTMADLTEAAGSWLARARTECEAVGDLTERSERVWCVSHFLFKGNDAPGVFVAANGGATAEEIVARARKRFLKTERAESGAGEASATPAGSGGPPDPPQ